MPIYMDRHDVSEEVTAEIVADLHQKDLKIQHKFQCVGLTYWFDDKRKTAFCLVQAPDKMAIKAMHDQAHGEVSHKIIEVDDAVVESFLGRIEDPQKSQKTALNIINDPAFRTIMVIELKALTIKSLLGKKTDLDIDTYKSFLIKTISTFKGRVVKQRGYHFLISFDSVSNAVLCALEIQSRFNQVPENRNNLTFKLQIGLSAGIPVSDKEGIFEETIQMAERLCGIVDGQIAITSEVKELYESENQNISIDKKLINVINLNDEKFLNLLMDYVEKEWSNPALNADHFSKCLGYSKSQLYRKMVSLTGRPLNNFLKAYRLEKALKLLINNNKNISEISYVTGFNTPAYFSKCFQETYGVLPSLYTKQIPIS